MFLKRFSPTIAICVLTVQVFAGIGHKQSAPAPSSGIVNIRYGNHEVIRYSLQTGMLAVYHQGKQVMYNIQAIIKANNKTYSSKDYTERKCSSLNISDGFGKGKKYLITMRSPGLPVMTQVFYTYTGRNYFLTSVELAGKRLSSNYMSPLQGDFTPLTGDVRSLFVPFDNDTFISYESRVFQPSAEITSAEVGTVFNNGQRNGFVWGSVEHGVWKTGVKTKAEKTGGQIIVWGGYTDEKVNRDPIQHGKISDDVIKSPKIFVGYFADWRNGMEDYGKANRIADPPYVYNWIKATPVGWNSWGVMQDKLTYDKAVKVVDFFADSLKGFRLGGTAFIDLDSYWDHMVKGHDYSQLKQFAN
jgi:alpha-galactosidase